MNAYSELSDADLAALAAADDQEALACLRGRYASMLQYKSKRASGLCGCDNLEDLSQEAAIGFLKAVRSFVPGGGASFRTYAERCVEHVLVSAIRSYFSQKNQPLNGHEALSDDEIGGRLSGYGRGSPDSAFDSAINSALEDDGEDLLSRLALTERERDVARLRMQGYAYREIAGRLQISVKSVDNTLQRVRHKMKSFRKSGQDD